MPSRPQSAHRLSEHLHAVVRSVLHRANVSRVIVACSGGADSTCLAHAVAAVMRRTGQTMTICHVQHHVRTDDAWDAVAVRTLAHDLGADFRLAQLPDAEDERSRPRSEGDLRDRRYRALAAIADDRCADAVLTGHTLDDQAETVLLHLMRGAGLDGLAGMREDTLLPVFGDPPPGIETIADSRRVRIIRPLLTVRHAETVAYCDAHNLAILHDPTNDDPAYTRNWLRHAIVPVLRERNPDIAVVLARTAAVVREDAAFLDAETTRAMARCAYQTDAACVTLRRTAFSAEHVAIQRRILRRTFVHVTGDVPRASDSDAAQRHASSTRSSAIRAFGGVACAFAFDRLVFGNNAGVTRWVRREAAECFPLSERAAIVQTDQAIELSVADALVARYALRIVVVDSGKPEPGTDGSAPVLLRLPHDCRVEIRSRRPADRFLPIGHTRATSLSDYLVTRGVPVPVRDLLPLLVVNDTIAWVIGHDVGTAFAATEETVTHCCTLTRIVVAAHERNGTEDG